MTGSDLSRRRLPFMQAVSQQDGPVVWITACGHGDEVGGIVVIQEMFKILRRRLLCGTVFAFPLMNPFGFEMVSRQITLSSEDLNRSFPGNPDGSLGERIAHEIFTTIVTTQPTLVLDLHNDWIESVPYALLDYDPGGSHKPTYHRAITAGKESGLYLVVDDEELKSSLSHNLLMNNIPALTLELGRAYVVNEINVKRGVASITNMLASLGMLESDSDVSLYTHTTGFDRQKLLMYSDKPYLSRTGILRFLVKAGEPVTAGQPLAKIVNAFGRHQETVKALHDGVVLGHSDSSAAFPGMPFMSFGLTQA